MRPFILALTGVLVTGSVTASEVYDPNAAPRLENGIKQYLGDEKGNYVVPGWLLSRQVYESLQVPGNPKDAPVPTFSDVGSLKLLQGCRPHSCTEKAAVIYQDLKVVGAAIISNKCAKTAGKTSCDATSTLTIFEHNPISLSDSNARRMLRAWGESKQSGIPTEIYALRAPKGKP
ncbi:hypothetical protein [Pseudomonas sp. Marseille-P9899]|uniref:hypothetical protein n=1 Tax=Pseudomonas sp. Marseille-P9899 TaxID=2730401 RepID=UPI00158857EF|nr:hypothetical protein [Pseudomonas sp. Marseille-P9899]